MRTPRILLSTALAAILAAMAVPEPATAQLGGLIKKKLKKTIEQTVPGGDTAAAAPETSASAPDARETRAAPPRPGPRFNEYTLEITPALLDRLEKGLAAEETMRQEIERKIGKVLGREEYEQCEMAVLRSPEGRKVYEQSRDLATGDTSSEHIQKASQELARRMEQVVEPKCGLEPSKAEEIRSQNADRLAAAGPQASELTDLQLSILKERILPLCTAAPAVAAAAGEVRVTASKEAVTNPIYYVYTPGEVEALRPRCEKLTSALRAGR